MNLQRLTLSTGIMLALSQPTLAFDIDAEAYGSLRVGVESVSPDKGTDDDYTGFRDAYSRVGMKFTHTLNQDWSMMAQLELPVDLANFDLHSPFDEEEDIRIAKFQVSSPLGTLWYGRGWLSYYNAIAYPVDYFSSYYSGWATFTAFRRDRTLYYSSPSFAGFSVAASTSDENTGSDKRRNQYTLSYSQDGLGLALGLDDNAGSDDLKIWGAAATYATGPWYLAAKYEELDYDVPSQYDGDSVTNLFAQYSIDDKNTVRAMVADVGWDYGDLVFHVGWDHQYNDDLMVFVEYYQEETRAAISTSNDSFTSGGGITGDNEGGNVITAGVRYDF